MTPNQGNDMHNRSKPIAISILLAITCAAFAAQAEPDEQMKVQAQAALREGNAALEQGRPADALAKFTDAYRLFASPKIYYNIGQAHSLLPGHEVQAYEAMSRFLNEAKDANPGLRAAAEAQRKQLRPKVGLVAIAADPTDAHLLVNDVDVGTASREMPVILGIGAHRLAIKKGGLVSATETVTITGGDDAEVRLRLASPPSTIPSAIPATPPAHHTTAPPLANGLQAGPAALRPVYWTSQRKAGLGLGGLAVASLVFGVVEHVRYFGAKGDYQNTGCYTGDKTPSSRCRDLKGQFDSANVSWIVGYIGAAALGGAGAYFLWLAPTDGPGAGKGDGGKTDGTMAINAGLTVNFQGRF